MKSIRIFTNEKNVLPITSEIKTCITSVYFYS